ncbi:hypothetical protein C7212DRAFT_362866 [Tuber magnatum]|uniref:Uncharacterized protein n=1 Tax=Tuber magnatum TaxID=42249 RepID=A0A317SRX4_9PEZI|nr:hypothetical protein C7212DRAFT_362866 [Tuber magnatum]
MEVTKLLQSGIIRTDTWPKGMVLEFKHGGACKGKKRTRDESRNEAIFERGKPKTVFEVKALIQAVMYSQGCKMEGQGKCEVEKGGAARIFLAYSQNTEYTPGGTQGTPNSSNSESWWTRMGETPSQAPQFPRIVRQPTRTDEPPTIVVADNDEEKLYDKMKLDSTNDQDYQPSEDIGMILEKGKNTEGTGLGNSRHVVESTEGNPTQEETVSSQGNRDMVACLEDYKRGNVTPAVVDVDEMIKGEDGEESGMELDGRMERIEEKVERLEKALVEERDRNDMLKDMILEIMTEVCRKCKKDRDSGSGPEANPESTAKKGKRKEVEKVREEGPRKG